MPYAHPLVGSPPLPVSPLVLAALAVLPAAVVATRLAARRPARGGIAAPEDAPAAAGGAGPAPAPDGAAEDGHPPDGGAVPAAAAGGAAPGSGAAGGAAPGSAAAGGTAPGSSAAGGTAPGSAAAGGTAPGSGPRWLWLPRLLSALALLGLVVVARAGPPDEPRNLAAVAVVHLVWPLLLVLSALAGPLLWRAVDPWRALGAAERLAGTPPPPGSPAHVWPAVVTGGAWAAFLGWYAVSIEPRALATVLATYTVLLVAGALAFGRDRWLGSADAVGLVVSWTGLLRRGRLREWAPPRGAAALLGAALGGVLFVRVRLSGLWGDLALAPDAERRQRLGALGAVLLGAGLGWAAERWATRRGAAGSVAAALVPVVAATAVAAVLRRAMIAAQLVPSLLTDPFERGWRLLGPFGEPRAVDVNPFGTAVQQGLAVALVALGALAGAWVLARRVRGVRARDPAALAVYVTTFTAVLVVASR